MTLVSHQTLLGLAKHGYLLLFLWTLVEQLGVPVPAMPILIAAGMLSATRQLHFAGVLFVGLLACLLGDLTWYFIGKKQGPAVLRFLCKLSLKPDTCLERSSGFISRYDSGALLFAKFVPGISTVAITLAANSEIPLLSIFFSDLVGSLLYVGTYLSIGCLLGDSIDKIADTAAMIRNTALVLALAAAIAILGWRLYRHRRSQR
jgi:membrane protein DedA with SNARE-associated domain